MSEETETNVILDIDKNLLDDEWLNQPKLYCNWALKLEDAREELDEAKAELDVFQAEIDLDIRTHPESYKVLPQEIVKKGKITEKMIAAAVIAQDKYREAQRRVLELKHRVGVLQAVVVALDQRKRALEKLVDLHGQKYFATPKPPENSKEQMQEIEKKSIRRRGRSQK